jgi:two-component system phosphate regulon response regulator PhoB
MLPDTSGFEVCRALKSSPLTQSAPVVMLTARGEEVDRVRGFEVGAEDYVLKPFSVKELLLRLKVILKRNGSQQSEPSPSPLVEFGPLRINRDSHQVWVEGEEVALTILEFNLICTFVERRGKTQSRAQLLTDVWGASPELTTRTVDTHVKRLRDKLKSAGQYIQTIRGVGYRFQQQPDD